MKKVISILIVLLSLTQIVSGQVWRRAAARSFDNLFDISFLNENEGWLSAEKGVIYHTLDGGNTFTKINTGAAFNLSSICFVNSNVGYAGGTNSGFIKTTDAGQTWQTLTVTNGCGTMYSIYFANELTGFVLTSTNDSAKVLKTTDGGNSWAVVLTHLTGDLEDMNFIDQAHGVVVGGGVGKLDLYYCKDGVTFTKAAAPSLGGVGYTRTDIRCVTMADENNVFASGWGSAVGMQPTIFLKSTDGGVTWTYQPQLEVNKTYDNINSIKFKDAQNGLAAGGGSHGSILMRTTDGGINWAKVTSPYGSGFQSLSIFGNRVWGAGSENLFVKSTDFGDNISLITNIPGTTLYNIQWTSDSVCYTAGYNGVIIKTTDKGRTWKGNYVYTNGISSNIYGMSFLNDNIGYTTHSFRTVNKTTDGGATWVNVLPDSSLNTAFCYDVIFLNTDLGFVGGAYSSTNDAIWKTTNGGTTWVEQKGILNKAIKGIDFYDENKGIVVAGGFKAAYTIDGGTTWTPSILNATSTSEIKDVKFITQDIAIAVSQTMILRTIDAGVHWDSVSSAVFGEALVSISARKNNDTVYAAGYKSSIPKRNGVYKSVDKGLNWTSIADTNIIVTSDVTQAVGVDNLGFAWVTGGSSSIYTLAPELPSFVGECVKTYDFTLYNNYPNPFNPNTVIKYSLNKTGRVMLKIYDILGKEIAVMEDIVKPAGTYSVTFDGSKLSSGVYFYTLEANGNRITNKMLLLK